MMLFGKTFEQERVAYGSWERNINDTAHVHMPNFLPSGIGILWQQNDADEPRYVAIARLPLQAFPVETSFYEPPCPLLL